MTQPNTTPDPAAKPPDDSARIAPGDDTAPVVSRAEPTVATGFGLPVESGDVGTLGSYRVVRKLGQGNMGAVYLAVDRRLGRRLALKVMLPEAAADPAARDRFLREGRAAALLSHDNVVTVYDADERDGVPYIAMQLLQGQSLDDFLKAGGKFDTGQILRIARETASALVVAHAEGLIHRDIKPANLWLEAPNGRVKVVDFGLAKQLGSDPDLTGTGVPIGTPRYMSPEQARGEKVDHRTDLFSLGSVLYLLSTGRYAFDGPHIMAVLTALVTDDPTPVRDVDASVPESLAGLIRDLMVKEVTKRVQTAQEVVVRIDELVNRLAARPLASRTPPPLPRSHTKVSKPGASSASPADSPSLPEMEPLSGTSAPPQPQEFLDKSALIARAREARGMAQVWSDAVNALLLKGSNRWHLHWAVIREAGTADDARRRLSALLGSEKNERKLAKCPTFVRERLRIACQDVGLMPTGWLLTPTGPEELELLLALPPSWVGYTAFVLLARDELNWLAHASDADRARMRERVREYLFTSPTAVAAYFHAARPHFEADPAFLTALVQPYAPAAAVMLDTLLTTKALEAQDWLALCLHAGLILGEWGQFLLENERLANLLTALGGDGVGRVVWASYLNVLTPALLAADLVADDLEADAKHAWERQVFWHLKTALQNLKDGGAKPVRALPEGGVSTLFAADNLIKWVNTPALAAEDGLDEIQHACDVFGIDRLDLIRAAYKRGGYDTLDLPTNLSKLSPLVRLFEVVYPTYGTYNHMRAAVNMWLRLSADCLSATRAVFQSHYILECVHESYHAKLLDERFPYPLEPLAVYLIRQRVDALKRRS